MTIDWHEGAFRSALRGIENGEPKNLVVRAQPDADDRGEVLNAGHLTTLLQDLEEGSPFLTQIGMQLHKWDAAPPDSTWVDGTLPSTAERRSLVCSKMGLESAAAAILLAKRPIYVDSTIVITGPWERWYTAERADERAFYWPRYRDYLLTVKKWPEVSVTTLDLASTQIVERLTDPTRPKAYQSKGLVVGYVQSGKTANFTGVSAKAIDAGYRLVIVMTGTIEMLRAQTQRRMDMELVGRQNILGDFTEEQARLADVDYQNDVDWASFLDLGPDDPLAEIRRLTHHHRDYQKQFRTLKIDRSEASRPLYDPQNLFRSSARLAIVKKNAAVLKKLVTDIKANRSAFAEIPVLIIDDESDQASVNTIDPEKVRAAKQDGNEIAARRAINEQIAQMLELMPRAQYVGYTATPFANVFVDPADAMGIFPRDFLIGLQRPADYMGVDDFHDLEPIDGPRSPANSNELAFVRHLEADDDDEDAKYGELSAAIDMFVLAGAAKLYRKSVDPALEYRHHTMLVHNSVRKDDQRELADLVRRVWLRADFANPTGKGRLRALYEMDMVPVSGMRVEVGVPPLPSFDALAPFIARSISKIAQVENNPVLVVNSDKEIQQQQQALDFDRYDIWRILVGGAKLSRGFTVEGLTVTYFRRATNMSDSLTQMGRWFGFRRGYRDLVRLYIARAAKFGTKTVDLFEAFQSIAIDEAAFRRQLERYAEWDGDSPRVRPIEVPPLVEQHLPWLQPTARNKMFNAELVEQSEQPFTATGYSNRLDHLYENLNLWRPVIGNATRRVTLPEGAGGTEYKAFVGLATADEIISILDQCRYQSKYGDWAVRPKVAFYHRLMRERSLKDFVVVVPQPDTEVVEIVGVGDRAVISRQRRVGRSVFGEITEVKHRMAVEQFVAGVPESDLTSLLAPGRGALLLYLAREKEPHYDAGSSITTATRPEHGLVAAYSLYVPESALVSDPLVLKFRVRDESKKDDPTIDAPS